MQLVGGVTTPGVTSVAFKIGLPNRLLPPAFGLLSDVN
jgi:hypothetical protein